MTGPNGEAFISLFKRTPILAGYLPRKPDEHRHAPWHLANMPADQRDELFSRVAQFVDDFNETYALKVAETIPVCWPEHPWLAREVNVLMWQWFSAHRDPAASIERAGEFYGRHLPGFRQRLNAMLGESPDECRADRHPSSWPLVLERPGATPPQCLGAGDDREEPSCTTGNASFGFPEW